MRRRSLIKTVGAIGTGLSVAKPVQAARNPSEGDDTPDGTTLSGDFPVGKVPETPTYVIGDSPPEDHSATVSFWNDAEQTRDVLLYLAGGPTPSLWWLTNEMPPGEVISIEFRAPEDFNIYYRFESGWQSYRLPAGRIDCNTSKVRISLHSDGSTSVSGFHTQLYCGADDQV
jgi:hypothetical protein